MSGHLYAVGHEPPCKVCGGPSMPNWFNLALCLKHAEQLVKAHDSRSWMQAQFEDHYWRFVALVIIGSIAAATLNCGGR